MGSEIIPILKPEVPIALPNEPQPAVDDVSAKMYNDLRNSVLKIVTDKDKSETGFIVDDGSHIVTSSRYLVGTKEQFAFGPDGKRYKLELEKMDDTKDLAILRIKSGAIPGARPLALGDVKSLEPDDRVWALSFPQQADSTIPYLSPGYARGFSTPFTLIGSVDRDALNGLKDKLKALAPEAKADPVKYLDNPEIESKLHVEIGSAGSPIVQKDGKVVSMTTMTNGKDMSLGQTIGAPVEDIKDLLTGRGRFEFTYKSAATEWAEQYKNSWSTDPGKAVADTGIVALGAGLAYKATQRYPLLAAPVIGTAGLINLSKDVNHLLQSTDSTDKWKYGLSTVGDLSTIGGAAMVLAPKLRGYGLALAAAGAVGRAAADFISNRTVLDTSKRLEGDPKKAPFSLDELLNNK